MEEKNNVLQYRESLQKIQTDLEAIESKESALLREIEERNENVAKLEQKKRLSLKGYTDHILSRGELDEIQNALKFAREERQKTDEILDAVQGKKESLFKVREILYSQMIDCESKFIRQLLDAKIKHMDKSLSNQVLKFYCFNTKAFSPRVWYDFLLDLFPSPKLEALKPFYDEINEEIEKAIIKG